MKTYIALLRGINVSGHRKIKMVDLRSMFNKMGFEAVHTYIQSGNVVFKSPETNTDALERHIKEEIALTFGFDVPVLIKERAGLFDILQESPFKKEEDLAANRIYYVLLKDAPKKEVIPNLDPNDFPNERFVITPNCVYLNCLLGAGKAKLSNNIIERRLKLEATTRNHKTMLKLLELSDQG